MAKNANVAVMPENVQSIIDAAKQEMAETLVAPTRYPHEFKHDELVDAEVEYCKALNEGETDQDVLKGHKKKVKKALDAYNLELAHYHYRKWNAAGNAVQTAVMKRFVPGAIKVSIKQDEESSLWYPEETSKGVKMKISLVDMQQTIGSDAFALPTWVDMCNEIAMLYADRVNTELGITTPFKHRVSKIAKKFDFDQEVHGSVYSNKFFLSCLQQTIDAILMIKGEDGKNTLQLIVHPNVDGVPTCDEWTYITNGFTAQGKNVGEILVGDLSKMAELVLDTMYLTAINGDYSLDYPNSRR